MQITRKLKGLELRVVISANIKSTIAVILSPNLSLYDLQKPRYRFGPNAATPKNGRGPPDLGLATHIMYPRDSGLDWSS